MSANAKCPSFRKDFVKIGEIVRVRALVRVRVRYFEGIRISTVRVLTVNKMLQKIGKCKLADGADTCIVS